MGEMQDGGGAEGIRTPGLLIANEALSQLSYSPVPQGADNAQTPRRKSSAPEPVPRLRTELPPASFRRPWENALYDGLVLADRPVAQPLYLGRHSVRAGQHPHHLRRAGHAQPA